MPAARAGQLVRHRRDGGHVPVRQRAGDRDRLYRRSRVPFRVASIASTASGGSIDRFATVSLRTAVAVAVGAPQVGRRVLAAPAPLVHVRLPNSDYVNSALFT